MALKIPDKDDKGSPLSQWTKEIIDECMGSSEERGMVYARAGQYYYQGTGDARAAIMNKIKPMVDKLAGMLMQPTDVRFQVMYDSSEPEDVLERAQLVGEKLTADFKITNSDVTFAESVVWALNNGCQLLKITPDSWSFKMAPVHPQNFGVLSETVNNLNEQEAFCHVSFPTTSRLRTMLQEIRHPREDEIIARIVEEPQRGDEEKESYFHQMVVGGMQPFGSEGSTPSAAGIVNVFPTPLPWKPQKKISRTVKFCELWVRDRDREGDYTTIQCVYGHDPIIIEGDETRRNVSRVPGHSSFVKVQPRVTPGYFWGRSIIADIQMLQDVLNKRLRDIKILWDRNVANPKALSGFMNVTEEVYFKIISEGGFIADPNPNAKSQDLSQPPPQGYLEELEYLSKLFDEAAGFSPIMSGAGEPGVRAGVHAQTLVRTSSPHLIDQAARIERQLADCGYIGLRIQQAMDPFVYETDDNKINFFLSQMPEGFQVMIDSHSASPAFAEDNRQVAIALARAGAIDAEDLIHMLHPPGSELLLARLRQRKKQQAQAQQQETVKELALAAITGKASAAGGGGRRRRPGIG